MKKIFGALAGFASGVMVVVAFLGLVREAWRTSGFLVTSISFLIGAIIGFTIDFLLPHLQFSGKDEGLIDSKLFRCGCLLAIGITLHSIPEGLSMGAGYLHHPEFGLVIAIAVALHNIPEGITTALPIYESGASKKMAFKFALLSGIVESIGAIGAALFLTRFNFLPGFLAFAGGVMFFITLDELVPIAHEHGHSHATSLGIILGAVLMMILLGAFNI